MAATLNSAADTVGRFAQRAERRDPHFSSNVETLAERGILGNSWRLPPPHLPDRGPLRSLGIVVELQSEPFPTPPVGASQHGCWDWINRLRPRYAHAVHICCRSPGFGTAL